MEILKAFSLYDKNYEINIIGTPENPLFQATQIAKLLEIRNIHSSICNFDIDEKVLRPTDTLGGPQEIAFLTELGLYRLLGRSAKPIAKQFQKWVANVIKEIRLTSEYKLKEQNEIDKNLMKQQNKLVRHNTLLQAYANKNVVYLCKIKDQPENKFIVKLGSSQDIKTRIANISNTYDKNTLLLDIFECSNYVKLEGFLHQHEFISQYHYNLQLDNKIKTTETYLVDESQYNYFLKIIKENIHKFNDTLTFENLLQIEDEKRKTENLRLQTEEEIRKTEELVIKRRELDIELKRLDLELLKLKTVETTNNQTETHNDIEFEGDDYIIKKRNNTRSPKVFQYSPEEPHNLIKIYDCEIDVSRENPNFSSNGIKHASKDRTIYKGYRWLLVDRTSIETPVLEPTVIIRQQEIDYVAMLDVRQQRIEKVYSCQKEGALDNGLADCGVSTISRAIKNGSKSCNRYWKMWKDCSKEMQDEYLKTNSLPEKFVSKNALKVIQIEPKTKKEVGVFYSKTEVLKKYQMGMTKLNQVCRDEEIYKGFLWKIVKET
jgi:prophage antirepressor-like protein